MVEVLVTGGAGFIGSNFVRYALDQHADWRITTLDKLTYAGRVETLHDVINNPRHRFVQGDVADPNIAAPLVRQSELVVHFAAETHVDRSILAAGEFIRTDVYGTFVLLEAAREAQSLRRFVQISTDEVYGSVATGRSRETDELKPRNPYSASKAGADRLAYSYWATFGVPVVVTRASNNYGPYQFPEKVIPLFVTNAIDNIPLPLYGDGLNVRDWLHVSDHCRALDLVIERGAPGEAYNIGGGQELANLDLTQAILRIVGKPESLIARVPDRPGHDRRYALDTTKLTALGWRPQVDFAERSERHGRVVSRERVVVATYQGNRSFLPCVLRNPIRQTLLMSVLVTGASGFGGSHLIDLLVQDETPVIGWYRPHGRAPSGEFCPMDGGRSARCRGCPRGNCASATRSDLSPRRCGAHWGILAQHDEHARNQRARHAPSARGNSPWWIVEPGPHSGVGACLSSFDRSA